MINFIQENKNLIESLKALGVLKSKRIIDAFMEVPRHLFVPEEHLRYAYKDIALPSLQNQTISQPYTVAVMLEALSPEIGDRVLDIGSGTGWTTCLLSRIVGPKGKVIGIEIEKKLVDFSMKNIKKIGVKNVEIIQGDGKKGYKKYSPYDCVLINAAYDHVPKLVQEQTKIGGRIVAPINVNHHQELVLFQKTGEDNFTRINLGDFVFVELK
ncbi:MAG: protein-L-isoaspartate(D-aspartate) O-methyltransferase [Candidatus Aenigmatarchaeota archaeon]